MNSIRRRLLLWQISALLLTGLLVSLITYGLAWHAFNRLRDDNLAQIAYSILRHGVVSEAGDEGEDEDDKGQFVSQIWDDTGKLVYSSLKSAGPPAQPDGSHTVRWNGEMWHVFSLRSGGLTIQVGNPTYQRHARFWRIAYWLLLPLIVLVAVLGALIWTAVGRALAPLNRVREEIGRRDIASLHALDTSQLPNEVVPVVEAINSLLKRLDEAVAAQRRFVADAAHELRTPLTAIRLQAQLASQAGASGEGLLELQKGVDRVARLVDQLLNLARLEATQQEAGFTLVSLDELAKNVVAEWSSLAEARAIDLGVTDCQPAGVMGQADSLRVMLGNLIDNALRYIDRGGQVDVSVTVGRDEACLEVSDNGPGIPVAERARVFDRFYRLAGVEVPGSGLGLAIVRQVLDAHHGRVEMADRPGGGLVARIYLPLAGRDG